MHLEKHPGYSSFVCSLRRVRLCWPRSAAKRNKNRADLCYRPPAGHRSLSLCSVTCWSSYNYSGRPHPSLHCCGVHRAHSVSGSAVLHKETITQSKQAPSTKRRGWWWGVGNSQKKMVQWTMLIHTKLAHPVVFCFLLFKQSLR